MTMMAILIFLSQETKDILESANYIEMMEPVSVKIQAIYLLGLIMLMPGLETMITIAILIF
jgi:hypothetical protein